MSIYFKTDFVRIVFEIVVLKVRRGEKGEMGREIGKDDGKKG